MWWGGTPGGKQVGVGRLKETHWAWAVRGMRGVSLEAGHGLGPEGRAVGRPGRAT